MNTPNQPSAATVGPSEERIAEIRAALHETEPGDLDSADFAITELLAYIDAQASATANLRRELEDARKSALDDLRALLCERSKGEVDTWGFVAAFMGMIDEVEKSQPKGSK